MDELFSIMNNLKKSSTISVLICLQVCFCAVAQEIKPGSSDFSDYISLLNDAGFEVYTFDISSLKEDTYSISFVLREYSKGELVSDSEKGSLMYKANNRRMIKDLPEGVRKTITPEDAFDWEKGIFSLSEKFSISFSPAADSLKKIRISVGGKGGAMKYLSLIPLNPPREGNKYAYDIRPFKLDSVQVGEFTPLLLVGSFWYDDQNKIYRFCGEREFTPDMASSAFKLIPHYYIVGVIVDK